ncbi:MAG: NAD(P)-dependent alcohol dehydrogenase [Proteobacteria bacterium]|nr:NAD(P)-dependent alcohol dehydrogenase [Pseudomonadota bacterium]
MKAVLCPKYGPAELLTLAEITKPTPKKDEVLIRIKATSVTASDVLLRGLKVNGVFRWFVQLIFGFGKPRNPVLGMVCSGIIERVGSKVTKFSEGDPVFAYGGVSPLKNRFGTYAEYICLPEDWNLTFKPKNLSFQESASLPYGGLLSMHCIQKADLKSGQSILIYGASGSIGSMAIQLAKLKAVKVTAVCSEGNFELVRNLGADQVIDYRNQNAIDKLEKYDWVFDAVGESKNSDFKTFCRNALLPQGKYISIDDEIPSTRKENFLLLKELAEQGKIKPVIDSCFPMEEMIQAHRHVEKGHKRGNVIINV